MIDQMRKGNFVTCPHCKKRDVYIQEAATEGWLSNKNKFVCPYCKGEVDMEDEVNAIEIGFKKEKRRWW